MAITFDRSLLKLEDNIAPNFKTCTPSATANQTVDGHYPRGIYVGTGGTLNLVNKDLETVSFVNVPSGFSLKGMCFVAVLATSTASDIVLIG